MLVKILRNIIFFSFFFHSSYIRNFLEFIKKFYFPNSNVLSRIKTLQKVIALKIKCFEVFFIYKWKDCIFIEEFFFCCLGFWNSRTSKVFSKVTFSWQLLGSSEFLSSILNFSLLPIPCEIKYLNFYYN